MRIGVVKFLRMGPRPCGKVERTSLGQFAQRQAEVESAGGGSSRQERICLVF